MPERHFIITTDPWIKSDKENDKSFGFRHLARLVAAHDPPEVNYSLTFAATTPEEANKWVTTLKEALPEDASLIDKE